MKQRLKSISLGIHRADCGSFSEIGVPGLGEAYMVLLMLLFGVDSVVLMVLMVLIVDGVGFAVVCDGVVDDEFFSSSGVKEKISDSWECLDAVEESSSSWACDDGVVFLTTPCVANEEGVLLENDEWLLRDEVEIGLARDTATFVAFDKVETACDDEDGALIGVKQYSLKD